MTVFHRFYCILLYLPCLLCTFTPENLSFATWSTTGTVLHRFYRTHNVFAETEHVSPDQIDDGKSYPEDSIKPLEKKALNFLVNQYLLQINNKLTSVTFSEENEEQVPSPNKGQLY